MARPPRLLTADFSEQFNESSARPQLDQQKAAGKAIIALLDGAVTTGLRVKPIEPDRHYLEACINDGDRLIHRVEGGRVLFVDVVAHDDIGRYERARKKRGPKGR